MKFNLSVPIVLTGKTLLGTLAMAAQTTVLVVDDDPMLRKIMSKMIKPLGVLVTEAQDGKVALGVLEAGGVDVVVCDLIMPHVSGLMLLHSMLEKGFHLPFIITTGYSDKDSAIQALRLGAFDYLEKPLNEVDLRSVVSEAIRVGEQQRKLTKECANILQPKDAVEFEVNAELQILKMRLFKNRGGDVPINEKSRDRNWYSLRDLFVDEACAQLAFCEASLINLQDGIDVDQELSFMFRVVQSIDNAAAAIKLRDVADFAGALSACLAALRINQDRLDPNNIEVVREASATLKEKIHILGSLRVRRVQERLEQLSSELNPSGDTPVIVEAELDESA